MRDPLDAVGLALRWWDVSFQIAYYDVVWEKEIGPAICAYEPRPSNKEPRGKRKALVEASSEWCNEERSSLASWQMIDSSMGEVDPTTDANIRH